MSAGHLSLTHVTRCCVSICQVICFQCSYDNRSITHLFGHWCIGSAARISQVPPASFFKQQSDAMRLALRVILASVADCHAVCLKHPRVDFISSYMKDHRVASIRTGRITMLHQYVQEGPPCCISTYRKHHHVASVHTGRITILHQYVQEGPPCCISTYMKDHHVASVRTGRTTMLHHAR